MAVCQRLLVRRTSLFPLYIHGYKCFCDYILQLALEVYDQCVNYNGFVFIIL